MSFFARLLQRLGFIRLSDHGLMLSPDGRVVSMYPMPAPSGQMQALAPPAYQPANGNAPRMTPPIRRFPSATPVPAHPQSAQQPPPRMGPPNQIPRPVSPAASRPIVERFPDTEQSAHGPTHVDAVTGTNPGGFWNPHQLLVSQAIEKIGPQPENTQLLEVDDLLECRHLDCPEPGMAPGVVPDSTRVDLRCPDFDFPGLKYDD